MDHFEIILSLIGVMFLAVIGVYIWTYKVAKDTNKQLGDIYRAVNSHLQNADIHPKKENIVDSKVCHALHTALKETVDEIKSDVKQLLAKAI